MDITNKKINLIRWLTDLNDIPTLNQIENIKKIHSRMTDEQIPLSIDELIGRHRQSENDILTNNLIEQNELANYFNNKRDA